MRMGPIVVASLLAAQLTAAQTSAPKLPSVGLAADTTYTPRHQNPGKREIVAYYIGSKFCGGSQNPAVKSAVRRALVRLQQQGDSLGLSFSAVGVAVDWKPEDGWEYLRSVSPFDEVTVGRNWLNSAAVERLWRAPGGRGLTPQIVIVVRNVHDDGRRLFFTPDEPVMRIEGGDTLMAWAARGAPIHLPVASPP